jgi:hypothetical protein
MLAERSTRTKIRAHVFDVASERDLLRLRKIARGERSAPGDLEDIALLPARRRASSGANRLRKMQGSEG